MYANDALMMGMNYLLCYLESNDDIIKQTLCTVNSGNDFATKCISILIHDNRRSVAKQQITKVGVYIQNSTYHCCSLSLLFCSVWCQTLKLWPTFGDRHYVNIFIERPHGSRKMDWTLLSKSVTPTTTTKFCGVIIRHSVIEIWDTMRNIIWLNRALKCENNFPRYFSLALPSWRADLLLVDGDDNVKWTQTRFGVRCRDSETIIVDGWKQDIVKGGGGGDEIV